MKTIILLITLSMIGCITQAEPKKVDESEIFGTWCTFDNYCYEVTEFFIDGGYTSGAVTGEVSFKYGPYDNRFNYDGEYIYVDFVNVSNMLHKVR